MRRWLLHGALLLLLTAGVLGLLFVALHMPAIQRWALRTIVERASDLARGRLAIGSLDYRLWLGEVTVRDIRFEPGREQTLESVSAEWVRAHWVFPDRVEIVAIRPVVHFRGRPEDPQAERRVVEPSLPAWIAAVEVMDARVFFRSLSGETRVSMGPIDVRLRADPVRGGARGSVLVEGGNVTFGPRSVDVRRVEADTVVAGGDIEVRARTIVTEAGEVEGGGRIEALSPFTARFDVDFRVDAARLGIVLLEPDPEGIGGALAGATRLEFGEDLFVTEGDAEADRLSFREVGPFSGDVRWSLRDDRLEAKGTFDQRGAAIEIEADLDLEASHQAFVLRLDSPSMNALLAENGAPASPWDSALTARMTTAMSGWSFDRLAGRGHLALSRGELAGTIDLEAEPGRLFLETGRFALPGGWLSARATVARFDSVAVEYEAEIDRLSSTIDPFVGLDPDFVEGSLRVSGRAAGPLRSLEAIRNSMTVASDHFRFRGEPFVLRARLEQEGKRLDFDRLSLVSANLGGGELSLSGIVDLSDRLLDVEGSLDSFPVRSLARLEDFSASATGSFSASGGFTRPWGSASIDLSPLAVRDLALPPVHVDLSSDGELVSAEVMRLDSGAGLAEARLFLGEDYLLDGEVDLGALPWTELAAKLPSSADADSISVSGEASFRVPLTAPSRLEGRARVESAAAELRGKSIATSPFTLDIRRQSVQVSDLRFQHGGEALAVDGILGLDPSVESRLELRGNVPLSLAEAWLPGRAIEGLVRLDLDLTGSIAAPRLVGPIEIVDGRVVDAVAPPETARSIENLRMQAEAAGARIEIASLVADVLGGEARASGTLPVPGAEAGAPLRLAFDVSGIDPIRLIEGARGTGAVTTSVSLGGEVSFPEGDLDRIEISGEIQDVLVATEGGVIYLVARAGWSYGPSGLRVDTILLEGDRTDLRVNVSPPTRGEALEIGVDGDVDVEMANAFVPDAVYLGGVAALDLEVTKPQEGFRLSGTGRLSEGELTVADPALAVTDMSARLAFEGTTVTILDLTARAGGGTLTGQGALAVPGLGGPGTGAEGSALRLDLRAEQVRIEYPEGMRSQVTADLVFESREERYRLSGRVNVVQAIYERPISPELELIDALRRETLRLKGEPGLLGRIDLDLAVSTERAVVVDNNLGQMRWSAGLLTTGTLASPEASGTLSAEPGGTLTFLGNTYELQTARVALSSYPLEPPELDIRARTDVAGREILLTITGRTDNLRTTLESPSDPSLSRGDVASLLLTGRTLEEVRGDEVDVVSQEAADYLGSSLASLTETGLTSALPLSTVRLEPGIVGSETDPGVRFSLGRAITDDLFLTYSIGLDDAEEQLWIIDYSLPRRLKLRAIRDDDNEYIGGLSQEALFDFYDRDRPKRVEDQASSEIVAIEVTGDVPLPDEEIDDAMRVEVGDDYDYWEAREDADRLVERLRARSYLTASAVPYTRPAEVRPGEPVTLVYEVDPGRPVSFAWTGDPLPAGLEDWVRDRFRGNVPARAQALRLGPELRWELMSRGYYLASVEPTVAERESEVLVSFRVALGPTGSGVDVEIAGNEAIEDDEIERLLPPARSAAFFELVMGRPEDLHEEVELLYAGEGFLDARVLELSSTFDAEASELRVLLRVDEGERFRVGGIVFSGAASVGDDELREQIELSEGEPFRFLTHLRDRQRITSYYRGQGFPDVRVRSSLDRGEARVDVTFEVEEGERVRVGEIRVTGARATRDGVVRDAVTFEPGDPLRLADLTETQTRLYNTRVFRSVDLRPQPSSEEGVRDVVIELTELPDLRIRYGGRYSTEDQLELTGEAVLTNLFGTARQLGLYAFTSRRFTELRATFDVPSFFGSDFGSSFFIGQETEEGEGFESRAWSATFQQGRRIFSNVLAQWSFTHRQSSVTETEPSGPFGLDLEADRSVLTFSLIEDTRSSLTRPRSGRFWNATLQFAPQFLGSDLRFIRLYGQFFLYRPLFGDVVWASTYRAGIADGFGQVLLPTDRFRAGGPSSVRGYPVNELGPPDPITQTVIGGEGVVIMNQELRFPLFWRFGGISFYDMGNVYLEASDFNPFDLRHTTGLGLSVDLPVGLVTIDWAVLINPPPGLDRTRWFFSFGYSF